MLGQLHHTTKLSVWLDEREYIDIDADVTYWRTHDEDMDFRPVVYHEICDIVSKFVDKNGKLQRIDWMPWLSDKQIEDIGKEIEESWKKDID